MRTSFKAAFIAAAAFAGLAGLSGNANAMDNGQCFSMPQLNQHLMAEGQHSLIVANEPALNTNQPEARIITSNNDGSVGYIFKADAPLGSQFHTVCVEDKLKDIKLYDARDPGVNPETLIQGNRDEALRQCELIGANCLIHNDAITSADQHGSRVMLQATAVDTPINGVRQPEMKVTITGHMGDSRTDGQLGNSTPAGAYILSSIFSYVNYTDQAKAILDGRKVVAQDQTTKPLIKPN